MDALEARVNEVEERVSNKEDELMERKEAEEKKKKTIKKHEERLQEINDSLRRNNIRLIGIPEDREDHNVYLNKSLLKISLIWGKKQAFISKREEPPQINKN